jgi:hypothetical protein
LSSQYLISVLFPL